MPTDGLEFSIMATKRTAFTELRKARKGKGETLLVAAKKLGIDAGSLSRIERGHVDRLSVQAAVKIEREYGIPVAAWVDWQRAA